MKPFGWEKETKCGVAPSNRGFSLVELMITIAVLGILLAIAAPSFVDSFEKARLRGAADDLATLLSTSRGEAVKRGRDVTVAFQDAWCAGANEAVTPAAANPVPASAACDCADAAACLVDNRRSVVAGAAYDGISLAALPAAVTFDGKLGNVTDLTPRNVLLTSASGRFELRLNVSPLGQTLVCTPAGRPIIGGYSSC